MSDAVGSDDCLRMQWNTTVQLVSIVCHEHSHPNVYTMHVCMYVCMYMVLLYLSI